LLRQVRKGKQNLLSAREPLTSSSLFLSYDLDMDTRLAEETTTLVESYTVSNQATLLSPSSLWDLTLRLSIVASSCPTAERSKSVLSASRRPSACSSRT